MPSAPPAGMCCTRPRPSYAQGSLPRRSPADCVCSSSTPELPRPRGSQPASRRASPCTPPASCSLRRCGPRSLPQHVGVSVQQRRGGGEQDKGEDRDLHEAEGVEGQHPHGERVERGGEGCAEPSVLALVRL